MNQSRHKEKDTQTLPPAWHPAVLPGFNDWSAQMYSMARCDVKGLRPKALHQAKSAPRSRVHSWLDVPGVTAWRDREASAADFSPPPQYFLFQKFIIYFCSYSFETIFKISNSHFGLKLIEQRVLNWNFKLWWSAKLICFRSAFNRKFIKKKCLLRF